MKKFKTYILHATIITVAIGTPKVVYGDILNINSKKIESKIKSNYRKMEVTGIEFNNKDRINKLGGGRFFLGDFKTDEIATTEDIKITLKGSNFKNVEKVRLVGGNNKEYTLSSSKGEVSIDENFERITLTIKDPIKKEIFGNFRDADGFFKNKKNTGKHYFEIDTVEELSDGSISRGTFKVDEKYYMEILDTISPKGTVPRHRERYFNPEDLKIGDTYYIKIDFDNNNDNFNYIKYSKEEVSNKEDIILELENNIDISILLDGEVSNKFDKKKSILVRKGSIYVPLVSRLEDGLTYEVIYTDDFFMDGKIKNDLVNNKKRYDEVKKINESIKELEKEIEKIEKILNESDITDGERKELENKKREQIRRQNELNKKLERLKVNKDQTGEELEGYLQDNYLAIINQIESRLTTSKRKFTFKVNAMPKLEKHYEGFVVEDYSGEYPILLEGKDFNHNMDVEFYGDGGYYRADEVIIEKDKAYVYLPSGRRLRPGMYDIILKGINGYETEIKYGVLSVVEAGKFIPNEDYFIKNEVDAGKVISLRSTSEDVLELNSNNSKQTFIEMDLDKVLGVDSWTRTIDFSEHLKSDIYRLKLTSSLFNLKIESLVKTGYSKESTFKLRTGRATPYIVESFRDGLRNFSIKSDFIEIEAENIIASSYNIEIPFNNSDGNNLKMLRYNEELRVFETISSKVNTMDGTIEGLSLEPGIFVVVE